MASTVDQRGHVLEQRGTIAAAWMEPGRAVEKDRVRGQPGTLANSDGTGFFVDMCFNGARQPGENIAALAAGFDHGQQSLDEAAARRRPGPSSPLLEGNVGAK
jgi:hypothetical protein